MNIYRSIMRPFAYLRNNSWSQITREERYFCAELFFEISKDVKRFIRFLSTKTKLNLNPDLDWEVGFEVCFYRDLLYANRKRVRNYKEFHSKRTFDICLFSQTQVVIIEAKAQEKFNTAQIEHLKKDPALITQLLNLLELENVEVITCLLYSTKRSTDISMPKFSWEDLYDKYKIKAFELADGLPDRPQPLD